MSPSDPMVIGYVEKLNFDRIEGWAFHRKKDALTFTFRLSDDEFEVCPTWVERKDVADAHGSDVREAGFEIELDSFIKERMERTLSTDGRVELCVNQTVLPVICPLPPASGCHLPKIRTQAAAAAFEGDGPVISAELMEFGHFEMLLKLRIRQGSQLPAIVAVCNGEAHGTAVKILNTITSDHQVTFLVSLELPGYSFQSLEKADAVRLNLAIGETELLPEDLEIGKETVVQWLTDISRQTETENHQFQALLALEHLHFNGVFDDLESDTQKYFDHCAQRFGLSGYIKPKKAIEPHQLPSDSAVNFNTTLLWAALRELNARLRDGQDLCSSIRQVETAIASQHQVKHEFYKSIVPTLCHHGEILRFGSAGDFSQFFYLETANNAWSISLAVACLTAAKEIKRAAAAMWRMVDYADKGWLSTECLNFAVTHALELETSGAIPKKQAEEVRYAFFALLDHFKGAWFSRLHDAMLVDACAEMIRRLRFFNDYHQQEVVMAAVRIYGLTPEFWSSLERLEASLENSLLLAARRHWNHLVDSLQDHTRDGMASFESATAALNFFKSKGNREADFYGRELFYSVLGNLPDDLTPGQTRAVEEMLTGEPEELIRIAASPFLRSAGVKQLIAEQAQSLRAILRAQHGKNLSTTFGLQNDAAQLLMEIASSPGPADLNKVTDLLKVLRQLDNPDGRYLGQDLTISLFEGRIELSPHHLLAAAAQVRVAFESLLFQGVQPAQIPPTAFASLSNLFQLTKPRDAVLESVQGMLRHAVAEHLGGECLAFLESVKSRCCKLTKPCFPSDTLVVVYSCQAYLNSRIKAIRRSWLKQLKARGIPYLILVGDGDDKIHGDVLHLAVSDTYEDLPQKTLRMLEWVYENTGAQYVIKIDDDCHLDVDHYFNSLSYRRHHYYGRVLNRAPGSMDRTWHQQKSQSPRARHSIDKSPEPSIYADGGGAYSLSRYAMSQLLASSQTFKGRTLIAHSFMEDKMVGDLLSLSGITPSNEDYGCYQRRRTFGAATPVGMWENLFFPSSLSPVKVTHLDSAEGHDEILSRKNDGELWPKKIWPSCFRASTALNSNQLELLSSRDRVAEHEPADFHVVAAMRNESLMLPHFLSHYRSLGVESFIIIDNCSTDGTRETLLAEPDVILYSADTEYKHSHFGVAWQQAVLSSHCVNKWVLVADADELLMVDLPAGQTLGQFASAAEERGGVTAFRTDMVDMYPYGDLNEADFRVKSPFEAASWHDKQPLTPWHLGSGCYSNRLSHISSLRHRIDPGAEPNAFTSQKYALFKYYPWVRLSQGLHDACGVTVAATSLWLAHFKYHSGFKEKIEEEIRRKQHFGDAKEYLRYRAMLAESCGSFGDPRFSQQLRRPQS